MHIIILFTLFDFLTTWSPSYKIKKSRRHDFPALNPITRTRTGVLYHMKKEKYIYERKTKKGSPYFQIQIAFKDEYGQSKTFYESVQISDYESKSQAKAVAIAIRDKALYEIQTNRIIIASPTVGQLYQKMHELIPCSLSTKKKYNLLYRGGIDKFENTQISKLTTADIQKNINEYAESKSDDCIHRYIILWGKLYKVALMLGYDVVDRSKMVVIPKSKKIKKKKTVTCSQETLRVILDYLASYETTSNTVKHRARMIWYLIIIMNYTGMRPAEVLALNAEDITNDYISVNKSVGSSKDETAVVKTPKTAQSVRQVPVHPDLLPILKQLKQEQKTSPLLTNLDGSLITPLQRSNMITNVCKKTGIKFNLYMLRHNMATDLINMNISQRTVQDILGHASFNMSLEYARSTEEDRKKAVDSRKLS